MNLTDYQLNKVQVMDAIEFGTWFLNGFKDWFNPQKHFEAFLPINTLSSDIDIIDQLQEVYKQLPEIKRNEWHNGIVFAVKNCESKKVWMLPLRNIFFLAHRLDVYEVVEAIRSKWIDEFQCLHADKEAQKTRASMINLLAEWCCKDDNAYNLLRDLVNRNYFNDSARLSDIPFVFIMMLKAKPNELSWLLQETRPLFCQILNKKSDEEQAFFLSNFVESLLYHIPLSKFVMYFDQLKIERRPRNSKPFFLHRLFNSASKDDDKWLIAGLFGLELNELNMYRIKKNKNIIPALAVDKNKDVRILVNLIDHEEIQLTEENDDFGQFNNLFDEIFSDYINSSIKNTNKKVFGILEIIDLFCKGKKPPSSGQKATA